MDIVLQLRELRRLRGLSQKQAAEKSGVGEKTISSFETGERIGSMHLDQFLALLSAYDVTPADFFGGAIDRELSLDVESVTAEESRLLTALREMEAQPRLELLSRLIAYMTSRRATNLRAAS